MPEPEIPVLFTHWEGFVGWLLDRTEGFPKRLRPTLTHRIENTALDVFDALVDARWNRGRVAALERANADIDRLRLLLRLAAERRALGRRSFQHACEELERAGRMVGGWLRQVRSVS